MDFKELAEKRYSVRSFDKRPVEDEKLDVILNAGRVAPTAKNLQPQKIYVLKSEEALEKINAIYNCWNAPTVCVICSDKNVCWENPFSGRMSYEMDASIVATHMMLAATELGVGSTWVCYFDPEKVKKTFSLPDNILPVSLLLLGYPASDAAPSPRHSDRKPLSETVTVL